MVESEGIHPDDQEPTMTMTLSVHGELWGSDLATGDDVGALQAVAAVEWVDMQQGHHEEFLRSLAEIHAPSWPDWPSHRQASARERREAMMPRLRDQHPVELFPLAWEEDGEGNWRTEPLWLDGPGDDDSCFRIVRTRQ